MFKTELHAHCAPISICASAKPEELIKLYINHGYNTIVVTNHLNRPTFENHEFKSYDERFEYFITGYTAVKQAAGGRLNVLLGAEIRTDESSNDYLCYGLTEHTLHKLGEDLFALPLSSLAERIHHLSAVIYQAHPMRYGMTLMPLDRCHADGVEIYNAHSKHNSHNTAAAVWAQELGLPGISGSDFHDPDGHIGGGIITETPIDDNETLLKVLKSGKYKLIKE